MTPRWKLLIAMLVGFALVAAACGDDDDDGDGDTTTTAAAEDGGEEATTTTGAEDGGEEATTTTAAEDEERTASDVGVTEDTIRIGVGVADLDGLRADGISLPEALTTDHLFTRYSSYFDEWNAEGGINGRMIEPVLLTWNPVDPASQDEMCATGTLDEELFFTIVANGIGSQVISCFIDGGVPFLFGETVEQAVHDTGMLLTIAPPVEVTAEAGVQAAIDSGQITEGDVVGILSGNGPAIQAAGVLVDQALQDAGFTTSFVEVNTLQGDTGAINEESAAAVGTFTADGVTVAINLLPFTQTGGFWDASQGAGFSFIQLDTSSSTCTQFGASRTPEAAAGAPCVTTWDEGGSQAAGGLRDETEFEVECRAHWDETFADTFPTASARGVPSGQVITTVDGEELSSDYAPNECTFANIVRQALENAGVNPTRDSFMEAAFDLGEVPVAKASEGTGSTAPGKTWVADNLHTVVLTQVAADTPRGDDGTFDGCAAPVSCWIPADDTWSAIEN